MLILELLSQPVFRRILEVSIVILFYRIGTHNFLNSKLFQIQSNLLKNIIKHKETILSKKSNSEDVCTIYVIDELGEERSLTFKTLEYNNLMDLVLNELWEEWGDCRGRAMCGTCHIEILDNATNIKLDPFEANTLGNLQNKTSRSRLACQITIDRSIHNMRFRILKDF